MNIGSFIYPISECVEKHFLYQLLFLDISSVICVVPSIPVMTSSVGARGRRLKGGFWSLFYWAHLMGNKAASEGTMRQTPPPIVARSGTSYLKQRWDIQPGSKLRYLTISRSRLRAAGPSRLQRATNNKPGSKSLLDIFKLNMETYFNSDMLHKVWQTVKQSMNLRREELRAAVVVSCQMRWWL